MIGINFQKQMYSVLFKLTQEEEKQAFRDIILGKREFTMYAHYICKVELCITVITSFCLVNSHQDRLPHMPLEIVIDDPIDHKHRLLEDREARSLTLTTKGLHALNQLLTGARRTPSLWQSTKMRRYIKAGDRDTALQDFHSVQPSNVKESVTMVDGSFYIKPGKVIDGTVGDRYLRLRLSGDTWSEGNPTLDIVDFKTANIPYVDQIVYKTLDD